MESEYCHHPACVDTHKLLQDCDFTRTKSGGPGGQHRNKVETMVVARHRPTGVTASAGERRSQHENKEVAMQRLRENLAVEHRCLASDMTAPSQLWQSRCKSGKIFCSSNHFDFACLLAEALNWISRFQFKMSAAADRLDCSTSQLIKFVKQSDKAFAWINQQRKNLDLGPLK